MQTKNRFLDDIAKVANTAFSSLIGIKVEIEAVVSHQLERQLYKLNLVDREEFEVVKAMATKARLENDQLSQLIERVENKLNQKKSAKVTSSKQQSRQKKN